MESSSSRYLSNFPGSGAGDRRSFERLLADVLKPFIRELLLVDAATLIGYALSEDCSNFEDIIASCGESIAAPALLRYGGCVAVTCEWGSAPAVAIELELHHTALTTFFQVVLASDSVEVQLHGLIFPGPAPTPPEAWRQYRAALSQTPQAASETSAQLLSAIAIPSIRQIM